MGFLGTLYIDNGSKFEVISHRNNGLFNYGEERP